MTEFRKTYTSVPIGETSKRHKVKLEDLVETAKGSVDARLRFFKILDMLVTTPDLGTVGPCMVADTARLHHDGMRWVLEMEAVAEES